MISADISPIPDDALLFDVAASAAGQHLFVITNGLRTVLSPTVPKGWTKLVVKVRTPNRATIEAQAA